jgi:coenzyme F420-reducing hydrogenase delta subunit
MRLLPMPGNGAFFFAIRWACNHKGVVEMGKKFIPKISIFHCINVFGDGEMLLPPGQKDAAIEFVKLPCSSMVKDVFLLRAFEAGADGVLVLVCPEGACRYVEGNLRAKKRVAWVKNLLDEIGLDGARLALFNVANEDADAVGQIVDQTLSQLAGLGPNPAA